jgi:hypothetical protein
VIVGREKAVEGEENRLEEGAPLLVEAGETHESQNGGNRPLETLSFYAARLLDRYSRRSLDLRGHEPIISARVDAPGWAWGSWERPSISRWPKRKRVVGAGNTRSDGGGDHRTG